MCASLSETPKNHWCGPLYIAVVVIAVSLPAGCGDDSQTTEDPAGTKSNGDDPDKKGVATDDPQLLNGLKDNQFYQPIKELVATVDPAKDKGWETESFSSAAAGQLKKIGKLLSHATDISAEKLTAISDESYASGPLRPGLARVFQDNTLEVWRASTDSTIDRGEANVRGIAGLSQSLQELAEPLAGTTDIRFKFKVVRVSLAEKKPTTSVYFEMSGRRADGGIVQQNATWHCRWTGAAEGAVPKLQSVAVENYEEIIPRGGGPIFTDLTEAVLGATSAYQDQIRFGADDWYGKLDVAFGIHQGNQGLAIADVNGDGLDDLYICQPAGLPNRLFFQQPDGTLKDVSEDSGTDWLDLSRSALFVDLDNDGDQDLVVVLRWNLVIHENLGDGRFEKDVRIVDTLFNLSSLSAVDYDNDGDLDLFVCGYSPGLEGSTTDIFANPVPYHDANNGARNFLMRNEGKLEFKDVTIEVGLDQNNRKFSFAAAWEDYDNDGDLDLYVANDFGRNNLYRNDDGKFTDVAKQAGVQDIAAGMSVSWADYDHDGHMDLYVSNMFSSAGNRIAFQSNFRADLDDETLQNLRRHARGNSLFRNQGDGTFADESVAAGVTMGRWAWGSLFTDINNDGREDIYVVNGFFSTEDSGDL